MNFKVFKFDNGDYLTNIRKDEGGLRFEVSEDVFQALRLTSEYDVDNDIDIDTNMYDSLTYLKGRLVTVKVEVGE